MGRKDEFVGYSYLTSATSGKIALYEDGEGTSGNNVDDPGPNDRIVITGGSVRLNTTGFWYIFEGTSTTRTVMSEKLSGAGGSTIGGSFPVPKPIKCRPGNNLYFQVGVAASGGDCVVYGYIERG